MESNSALCFRSVLRRCPKYAKKKPVDFAVPPTAELLPGNRSCYRKRRIGDRVANTLYVQQKVLARARAREQEGGRGTGGRRAEEGKKAIGKIRRNCAPLDTPAPGKLEIARIPMCKAAKALAHGRTAPSELLPGGPRWKHSGHVEPPGNTLPSAKRGIRPVCKTPHANGGLSLYPVPILRTVTCGST